MSEPTTHHDPQQVGEQREMTPEKQARVRALFESIGIKGEFAKTAKRLMRQTPEYERAKKEQRADDWLDAEANSFAESAYELLLNRLEDLDA